MSAFLLPKKLQIVIDTQDKDIFDVSSFAYT